MVILGEAGMGKTSLLGFVGNYAKRHGVSVHVLRGMESEAVIPFVAITDLLWPLRSYLLSLPTVQREAAPRRHTHRHVRYRRRTRHGRPSYGRDVGDPRPLAVFAGGPAERLGLVACLADRIRLRHPWLRSVVLARTPIARKVSAYRALAGGSRRVIAVRGTSPGRRSAPTRLSRVR